MRPGRGTDRTKERLPDLSEGRSPELPPGVESPALAIMNLSNTTLPPLPWQVRGRRESDASWLRDFEGFLARDPGPDG